MSRKSLQSHFSELDQRFFKGRLKGYRVKWCYLPGAMYGQCDTETRTIKIQRGLRGEELRRVMLHEMCHHAVAEHGKKFQAELRRLGRLGEAWVEEEIEVYREAQPFRAMIEERAEDAAMEQHGRLPWRTVKRYIAHECGTTSPELGRKAPWLHKFYERKVKRMKQLRALRAEFLAHRSNVNARRKDR